MPSRTIETRDESGTAALGAALAKVLPAGTVVALCGTLGAGKTRLVQAIATALGAAPGEVVSPTFVLVHEYATSKPIYHFDVYRLRDEDEFLQLGPEEYFDRGGLTLIEWGDRVERCMPADHLRIDIEVIGSTARRFRFEPHGQDLEAAIAAMSTN